MYNKMYISKAKQHDQTTCDFWLVCISGNISQHHISPKIATKTYSSSTKAEKRCFCTFVTQLT